MPLINQISIPRFDSMLSKLLGIKERQVAPSVGTELIPVVPVQDPAALELDFVRGESTWWMNDTPIMWGASFAAIQPVICIGNPIDSRKLVTIERWQFYPAPEDNDYFAMAKMDVVEHGPFAPGFGGVGFGFPAIMNPADWNIDNIGAPRDTRWASPQNLGLNAGHALQYFTANKVAAGIVGSGNNVWSGASSIWTPFNIQPARWEGACVLAPGAALRFIRTYASFQIGAGAPDTDPVIKFDMMWKERPLEDSEIRPGSS